MTDTATQVNLGDADGAARAESVQEAAFEVPAVNRRTGMVRRSQRRYRELGVYRKKYVLHKGLVPEPKLTQLAAVNFMFDSLGVRRVDMREATAAVEKVKDYYGALGQAVPVQVRGTPRRVRRPRVEAVASPPSSQAALSQPMSQSVLAALSASQVSLTQGSANAFLTDIQDALLLEVMRELCSTRPLRFSRMTYRDQRRMKEKLSRVDVPPGRRVILVADRRDPFFSIILGVPSPPAVMEDNTVAVPTGGENAGDGHTAAEAVGIQFITVANKPVPWRRCVDRVIPKFSYKDCAIAFIERVDESSDDDGDGLRDSRDFRRGFGSTPRKRSRSTDDVRSSPRRHAVLLGGDETRSSDAVSSRSESDAGSIGREGDVGPRNGNSANEIVTSTPSHRGVEGPPTGFPVCGEDDVLDWVENLSSCSSSSGDSGGPGSPKKWSKGYRRLFCCSKPFFTEEDGAGPNVQDPLSLVPRVEIVGDNKRRRSWVERMLSMHNRRTREATMSQLNRFSTHEIRHQ